MKGAEFLKTDEKFARLVRRIKRNGSPANNNVKSDLDDFLEQYDLEISLVEGAWKVVDMEKEQNIPLKPFRMTSNGRKPISDTLITLIREKRLEGHSVRSIARELKVGEGTVKKYMNRE